MFSGMVRNKNDSGHSDTPLLDNLLQALCIRDKFPIQLFTAFSNSCTLPIFWLRLKEGELRLMYLKSEQGMFVLSFCYYHAFW